jgi:protein-L-isoaspartate(D-aspartate) O-methyltransferase
MNFEQARFNMVEAQVRPWGVYNQAVLDTMAAIPREAFVPAEYRRLAYSDTFIPIGEGQHMLRPNIDARLLQALRPGHGEQILEIGTGSGYLTACLAALAHSVHSVEAFSSLASAADARLRQQKLSNVYVAHGDPWQGYQAPSPFDAIVLGAAVATVPAWLQNWLRPGGRVIAIVGQPPTMEARLLYVADAGQWREVSLFDTCIDAMIGAEPVSQFEF